MATLQGVYTATVLDNRDREDLARVFVRLPGVADAGIWARVATMMAGRNRGTMFVPDVGDEVLVAFERGDMRYPYVIGALWNGKDKPPVSSADAATTKMIRSRSGVTFRIDDKDHQPRDRDTRRTAHHARRQPRVGANRGRQRQFSDAGHIGPDHQR